MTTGLRDLARALPPAALALCLLQVAHAQSDPAAMTQGAQSPEAASLGEFGDVPVGYHSGTPDVSVPLHEVVGTTLSVPVRLRYHASGVGVNEVAGWVGLGWSLEAGGVVTRTVRGLPDEDASWGYPSTAGYLGLSTNWPLLSGYPDSEFIWNAPGQCSGDKDTNFLCHLAYGYADPEPDLYFFNVAGRSGQFAVGPGGPVVVPAQALRVEGNAGQGWTITTEDGTEYVFTAGERTTDQSVYTSSWFLTEVRSATGGDAITFTYEWNDVATPPIAGGSERDEYGNCSVATGVNSDGAVWSSKRVRRSDSPGRSVSTPFLRRIESSHETVEFCSSGAHGCGYLDRQDRPFSSSGVGGTSGLRLMQEVRVETPAGDLVRRIRLTYGYFREAAPDARRLRLDRVETFGSDGASGGAYRFDYVDDVDGVSLPDYGSFARDHWGQFNGATSNQTALPPVPEMGWTGGDRSPNPATMTAGILERITYPTGGHTSFVYEPHDYSAVGDDQLSAAELDSETVDGQLQTTYRDLLSEGSGTVLRETWVMKAGTEATVPVTTETEGFLEVDWPRVGYYDPPDRVIANAYVQVRVVRLSDGSAQVFNLPGQSDGNPKLHSVHPVTLVPGETYRIDMRGVGVCDSGLSECDVTWSELYGSLKYWATLRYTYSQAVPGGPVAGRVGGGVRVREIRDYDGTAETRMRRFTYRLASDPDRSSGVVLAEPVIYVKSTPSTDCLFIERRADSYLPLGSAGSAVGYREVRIEYGVGGEGGAEVHAYTTAMDSPDLVYDPTRPPLWQRTRTDTGWRRGHPVGSQVLADDGSSGGALLRQTGREYDFRDDRLPSSWATIDEGMLPPSVSVLRGNSVLFLLPTSARGGYAGDITYEGRFVVQNPYYIISAPALLKRETVTTYDAP